MTLVAGQVIEGKYRIVRVLGVGGMGAVYEGENVRIHRKVAIKVLHAQVASKADIVQRFEREAQAAGRIGSEHIVEVLDLGNLPSGERFMVMEYLDGEPLTNRIKARGRLTAHEAAPLLRQLLEGLAAAHAAGIIHRDLKPDNVYIVKKGGQDFVKILDFGVSKFSGTDSEFSMTRTGAVMGTPYYMSPEQARGQKIDARSDLYSIGVVAYQAVTGKVPFNAETFNELIFKIALETPEPVEACVPGFDAGFSAIVRKAMAREPDQRFSTAYEFAQAIDAWRAGAPMQHPAHAFAAPPQQQLYPAHSTSQAHGASHVMGTSGAMGISGAHNPPLGQSGSLGQSGGALGQSGGALGQSGGSAPHPMGQSQVALSVTTPEPKRSPVVAAIAITAVLGIGGGLAAYKLFGVGGSPASVAAAAAPTTAPEAPATAAPTESKETPPPAETAKPEATAAVTAEPTAEPTAAPEAKAPDTKPQAPGKPSRPSQPPPAKTSTPQQPPPSSGSGRSIGTDL
jgi:serine/threonine-protein kinase